MQKYRGHLYNWYDTRDLRPLEPRYVSSVDSGNLAAHLIALAAPSANGSRIRRRRAKRWAACRFARLARSAARLRFRPATITRGMSRPRSRISKRRCAADPARRMPTHLRAAAERASTLVDMVRTLASESRTRR
jgi:cyclic beta-1,2-glucan synthetase